MTCLPQHVKNSALGVQPWAERRQPTKQRRGTREILPVDTRQMIPRVAGPNCFQQLWEKIGVLEVCML